MQVLAHSVATTGGIASGCSRIVSLLDYGCAAIAQTADGRMPSVWDAGFGLN